MASYDDEAAVVQRLLDRLGWLYTGPSDPLDTYGRETGADVEIGYEGRRIGIQVTDVSVDEGITDPRRGLRATEKRNAAQGKTGEDVDMIEDCRTTVVDATRPWTASVTPRSLPWSKSACSTNVMQITKVVAN